MNAAECIQAADVDQALALLTDEVRKDPANSKHRIFLFQLLAVLGQWDRSLNQLNVVGDMDDAALAMVQTYREALQCEALRERVFRGELQPLIFGRPPEWVAWIFEALKASAQGRTAEAQEMRGKAFEGAPTTAGKITLSRDGSEATQEFAWIADADSRLGPMLEAIVNGKYYWVPFSRIREIKVEPPADLRDVVWTPAYFTWANGGEAVGLIPTRYPGTETSEDGALRMGRRTEWVDRGDEEFAGLGQRLLSTDVDEYALMDVRRIELESEADEGE